MFGFCGQHLYQKKKKEKKKGKKVVMAIGVWNSITPSLLVPSFAKLPLQTC
jgi:hypothetical protein